MLYAPKDEAKKKTPELAKTLAKLLRYEQTSNIAEDLDEEKLEEIAQAVVRKYKIDKQSRSDWEEMSKKAMDVALQVRKPKNYPFEGAANIKYPLVTVAALQFGARAYPAIVDGNRIVKGQVVGSDAGIPIKDENGDPRLDPMNGEPLWLKKPGDKRAKADRVSKHMSYMLLNEMEEWEEDTDVLLHHLPIVGCAFRKVYRSETMGRNVSEMVPAIHLVVNNKCRSLEEAPAVTHEVYLYPQEIEERKLSEVFLDIDLGTPVDSDNDEDAPHLFLEQHCFWDLDGDGYKEPYIVTVHKDDCKVLRIVANFRMEEVKDNGKRIVRIPKDEYFVKYSFIPDPKGGFYDIGFGQLLESLGETIDTTINQMLDAGHLQNAGGGFIGTGIRLKKGGQLKVAPGRYDQVETSGSLKDQILPHQFPGPSEVLFNLLGMMIEASKDITAVKDILTGDTNGQTQTATTTLAMIEQGLKVFTAIYKRIYRALKDEFKLLFRLNAQHIDEKTYYTFQDQEEAVEKTDYDLKSMDVCPVADPKMVTDMQRTARAQVLMQIAEHPAFGPLQDNVEALKRIYESTGTEDADTLIKKQQGPSPAEQAQLENLTSETAKNVAAAHKLAAEADEITGQAGKPDGEMNKAQAEHAIAVDKANLDAFHQKAKHDADLKLAEEKHRMDMEKIAVEAEIKARADERAMELHKLQMAHAAEQHKQKLTESRAKSEKPAKAALEVKHSADQVAGPLADAVGQLGLQLGEHLAKSGEKHTAMVIEAINKPRSVKVVRDKAGRMAGAESA